MKNDTQTVEKLEEIREEMASVKSNTDDLTTIDSKLGRIKEPLNKEPLARRVGFC
jgi:hypothetical protein